MPSSLRLLVVFLMIAGLACVPVHAQPLSDLHSDVLLLSPVELQARDTAVRVLAGPAAERGERVAYRAFNGKVYELTRFKGKHVDVLLPDPWLRPGALTPEQAQAFTDRNDVMYQHFLDLVGAPPAGKGRLPIAVVPETCGGGCALRGAKGVELYDFPESRPYYWREIAEDAPSGTLIHEMTHNFDLFSSYVAYTWDPAHAWTSLLTYYYHPYTREGLTDLPFEDLVKQWVWTSGRYFRDPEADWRRCVRDDRCLEDRGITAELAWAGFAYRLALLDGPQAVRGFLAFLRAYKQSHQPPRSAEAKNDLYVEALSAGARRNLSCVADAWRWHLSDNLRERLGRRYPGPNPDCQDRDGDGFSPIQGDCNDRRPLIHPGAAEQLPGVDEDCDGRVDEEIWSEPAGGDFAEPQQLTLPAEVIATAGGLDADSFLFNLESPGRVWIEGCPSRDGTVVLFDEAGAQHGILPLTAGACLPYLLPLDAGTWKAEAGLTGRTGGAPYSISIEASPPWPPEPWAQTAPPERQGNSFVLTAASLLSSPPAPGAKVRFWVSGRGIVGTVPYADAATFVWTPPAGLDPVAEGLTYRVQLLVGGAPGHVITRPQSFAAP